MAKKTKKQIIKETTENIRAVDLVVTKFKELETLSKTRKDNYRIANQIYLGTYEGYYYKGSSRVKSDAVFRATEALVGNLDSVYNRNDPPFNGVPTEGSDVELLRTVHTPLIKYDLNRGKLRAVQEKLHRMGIKYGDFIAKKVYDPKIDSLRLVAEDPDTVFYNTAVNDYKDLDIIIKRKVVSYDYLKKRGYNNLEMLFLESNSMVITRTEKEKSTDDALGTNDGESYNPVTAKHELLEADVSWDVNNDGKEFEERIITVINRKVLVRNDKNDFGEKRYYFCPFIPTEDSLAGIGLPMACKELWVQHTDTINQSNDNVTRNLNEHRYVNEAAISSKKKFVHQANNREYGITFVNGIPQQTIMVDRPPLFISEIATKINTIEDGIMSWSGAFLTQQGMPLPSKRSATEVQTVTAKSELRILLMMRRLENNIYNEFIHDLFRYNTGDFGSDMRRSEQEFIRILGSDAAQYADKFPKSIRGDYDFFFGGSTEAENRLQKANGLTNYLNIYVKIPPQMLQDPALRHLLKRTYELITGNKDVDEIFPKEAPKESISQEHENVILNSGSMVMPNQMDDHTEHIRVMAEFQSKTEVTYPMLFETHKVMHEQILNVDLQGGGRAGAAGKPTQEQPQPGSAGAPGAGGETQR